MSQLPNPKRSLVVAVSGTSGAGKSTLIKSVASLLEPVACLSFDDYVSVENTPGAIKEWLENGADPSEYRTPQLTIKIQRWLAQAKESDGPDHLLVDDPFGRARPEMSELIDLAVFIDLPPEIALARRLVRTLEQRRRAPEPLLEHVLADLRTYLAAGHEAYMIATRLTRERSELILDGRKPVEELAATLLGEINRRRI